MDNGSDAYPTTTWKINGPNDHFNGVDMIKLKQPHNTSNIIQKASKEDTANKALV